MKKTIEDYMNAAEITDYLVTVFIMMAFFCPCRN
jgi:hypothetical protein